MNIRDIDPSEYCRPQVLMLAVAMEARLRESAFNHGWANEFPNGLLGMARHAVQELDDSLDTVRGFGHSPETDRAVWKEGNHESSISVR